MRKFLYLLLFCLISCQSISENNDQAKRYFLSPEISISLPNLNEAPKFQVQQLLTIRSEYPSPRTDSVITAMSLSDKKLQLTVLSTLGIKLAELVFDGNKIKVEQSIPLFTKGLPPLNQIIGDILLANLPRNAWFTQLPSGWKLLDENNQRWLLNNNDELIMKIIYQDNNYHEVSKIIHYKFKYQIDINTLEYKDK